jgi:glycosyltransferase involved in cell wall biosynthesis
MTARDRSRGASPTLGVLVITHNEEANIERCLSSVGFADRVVVVDSVSTDRTAEIARSMRADVHVRPWPGYSEQKEYALRQLDTDWVLWIDADEVVSPELQAEIDHTLAADPEAAGFYVPRLVVYLGREIRHGGWFPDPKLRLFRRRFGRFDGRLVHEGVVVEGETRSLRCVLYHYPYRDVSHHREKVERYAALAAEQIRADGRRVSAFDLFVRPPARFLRMWVIQRGFLDGGPGFTAALMGARYVALKYRRARGLRAEAEGRP